MQSGKLDTKITIEKPTQAADAYNEPVTSGWTTHATAQAEKIFKSVDEVGEASQVVAVQMILWRIRYQAGITEKMRINDGTDKYYIMGIETVGRVRELMIKTIKRDNE